MITTRQTIERRTYDQVSVNDDEGHEVEITAGKDTLYVYVKGWGAKHVSLKELSDALGSMICKKEKPE